MKYHLVVRPNRKIQKIAFDVDNNNYIVDVVSRPIDGEANAEVITTMAKYLDVPKSLLTLEKGSTSHVKVLILNK